ncbi:hypothetical protein ASPZODRAFT_1187691 [Penicilliopsis zonata CBS 506.65]|uniref:Uncharacterized protein n=1 Tax=Penicilliopsis zonata CBS 506.65 TaxID=1073090 RepID=A0A1L9S7Z1_9EURO|nr:hypothetical protein ASPZODRAFT_1187691 [Penicilliopsis zonata CBS 506.65]OJJ43261.1 hypothetical protein ASPZODRAFT_1187691 [Penicilliopsis zonata CBS 506.65]
MTTFLISLQMGLHAPAHGHSEGRMALSVVFFFSLGFLWSSWALFPIRNEDQPFYQTIRMAPEPRKMPSGLMNSRIPPAVFISWGQAYTTPGMIVRELLH